MPIPKPREKEDYIGPASRAFAGAPKRHLSRELLDWLTEVLTMVLTTEEVHILPRVKQSLTDALKQADRLWPYAPGGDTEQPAGNQPRTGADAVVGGPGGLVAAAADS